MSYPNRLHRVTSASYLPQTEQPRLTRSNSDRCSSSQNQPYSSQPQFVYPYASISNLYNQSVYQPQTMPYFYIPQQQQQQSQPYYYVIQQGSAVQQQPVVYQQPVPQNGSVVIQQGSNVQQQPVYYQQPVQQNGSVVVQPAPNTYTPAPAPAPAPTQTVIQKPTPSSTGIVNPLTNSTRQEDNPLNWPMYSQELSAVYIATPPKTINTTAFCFIVAIDNTDNNKFYLANPIFDGMNDGQLCHDFFNIPITQATFLAGCLKDKKNCDPTARNIRRGLVAFVQNINQNKGEGHFYYSGHGMEQPGGNEEDLVGEDFGTTNQSPGETTDADDSALVSDRFVAKTLGSDLDPDAELYFVDDSCHGGGANWPYVLRANEMDKGVQSNPEGDANMAKSGRSMVFTTCLKTETAADGQVGKGGAGTIAFRKAIAKLGFEASCEAIVKAAQADLDQQGMSQHVSIFSNRPFKMTDPFYSLRVTSKIDKTAREMQSIPVLHSWQKKYLDDHKRHHEMAAIRAENATLKDQVSQMNHKLDAITTLLTEKLSIKSRTHHHSESSSSKK